MSRLMNGLFEGNGRTAESWVPTVDAWETDNDLVYAFDLPGVPEEQNSIDHQHDTLTASAQRERTQELTDDGFVRFERLVRSFSRAVRAPHGVTDDKLKADYSDGVLEIRVAKPDTQKPQK